MRVSILFTEQSLALYLILYCATAFQGLAQSKSKTPSLHQLPAAVQKTVQAELGDAKLIKIEQEEEEDDVSFTVTKTFGDGQRYFTVSEDGKLLSAEVSLAETPPAVQNAIKMQVGQGTLESI